MYSSKDKNLTSMKKLSQLALSIFTLFSILSCNSLYFTEDQFPEIESNYLIPTEWHGEWTTDSDTVWVKKESFNFFGWQVKINDEIKNKDSTKRRSKIIFQDEWCFAQLTDEEGESFGYNIFLAKRDPNENILVWEMKYDYFLENQYISTIPVYKFELKKSTESTYGSIMASKVLVDISSLNKMEYSKMLGSLALVVDAGDFICDKKLDIEVFKKATIGREPDITLTSDHSIIGKEEKSSLEMKFEATARDNYNKLYIKTVQEYLGI